MAIAPLLEDKGPLSGFNYLLAQDSSYTRSPLPEVKRLDQYIRQLAGRSDSDQPHLAILDDFVGEVLPDVNVLSTLSSTDDVVSYSMHAVLSSYTRVGLVWAKPMFSKRLRRYKTSVASVEAA